MRPESSAPERSDTLVGDATKAFEEGSFAKRPAWLKEMATVDSINRYDHEDYFESLGYDFATRAEARKTLEFEITNEAYEYSGLLRRMLQSNRDAETTESTEDSPQIYSVSD